MTSRKPNALYRNLSRRGFRPSHVAEVGVHEPINSNVYDYILTGVRCTLVEPNPGSVRAIQEAFAGLPNVTLHPFAIHDSNGRLRLVRRGPSTYVEDVGRSPAAVNDRYVIDEGDICVVEGRTFDTLDDGTIDLLSIDVEGCEWFVIKNLTSRPRVITLETHGSLYRNPYLTDIHKWMRENGYTRLYRNSSDSTFALVGGPKRTVADRLGAPLVALYITYKRTAKWLKHSFQSRSNGTQA